MTCITADRIHNGKEWLPAGSAIELNDDGLIAAIVTDYGDATRYDGILIPGFVNAHCHLELCHMKGAVPEHTGLIPFLKTIPTHRNNYTAEDKAAARLKGYEELLANGVVAVGDIANTADTLDLRAQDKMHVHTFVEAIGFNDANAQRSFGFSEATLKAFAQQTPGVHKLSQSITPHAPYSVSRTLFGLIGNYEKKTRWYLFTTRRARRKTSTTKTKQAT